MVMYIVSKARVYRQPIRTLPRALAILRIRGVSSVSAETSAASAEKEAYLFIDSVFPIRFGTWDLRHYIGVLREEHLVQNLHQILNSVKTHDFRVLSVEPQHKDGGVFVKCSYADESRDALDGIVKDVNSVGDSKGGFPTWTGLRNTAGRAWIVRGKPWREDLRRFPSALLKVGFQGPDILEEGLYEVLRPYGRILDISPPVPGPSGTLRSSLITFHQARASVTARNCVHGFTIPNVGGSTRLNFQYERPIKAHAIRDWIAGHPRIVIPVLVLAIGTVTYTIFDPIRVFVAEGKLLGWFDYRKSKVYQWLRANTVDRLSFALSSRDDEARMDNFHLWKERRNAEQAVLAYLNDLPNTIAFVHGPRGSGKSSMLSSILKANERPVLVIDCTELSKAKSDSAVLSTLAHQTGYWPVFPFINSLNNLIDIASVGLIGQKAGLSSSLEIQIQQVLEVVGTALKKANSDSKKKLENKERSAERAELSRQEEARRRAELLRGIAHDPRWDFVSGIGVISELGFGDELLRPEDLDNGSSDSAATLKHSEKDSLSGDAKYRRTPSELQELKTKPIVIIKEFETRHGRDDVLQVLAKWAATLANNGVAHVVVLSDNRENARELARALPSKPLHTVALSDADTSSAQAFVAQKLRESGIEEGMSHEQTSAVERLGGRASDLETLIHKVRSGQKVEDAVEDIITRGVYELRKTAFGEDAADVKSLNWSREQAWTVLKQLAKNDEIPYHEVLLEFPFKGDETALRNMEHADLIIIGTHNGRPSTIRPGRPVYRYVFQRVVADPVFFATQELSSNTARIAAAEVTVHSCEEELSKLASLHEPVPIRSGWFGRRNASVIRASYLLKKMHAAELSIEKLEAANTELKKVLSKNR